MTTKVDFTSEEWELLCEAPSTAGMIVITAEKGGQFRESMAMAKAYVDARKEHGDSQLLDELVAAGPKVDHERFKSPEGRREYGLAQLDQAAELLASKATPQELEEYRAFVNGLSKRAAAATKGGILRRSKKRISAAEQSAMDDIAYALDSGGRWSSFNDPEPSSEPTND
jgi:hypothetical protein